MIARAAAFMLGLTLVACTNLSLIEPKRVTLNSTLSIEPRIAWNQLGSDVFGSQPHVLWTADGELLNRLVFYTGVADGKALIAGESRGERPLPFRSTMSATEVMELFEATLTRLFKAKAVSARDLRPQNFGGTQGFRFEISYVGPDELERDGLVAGTVHLDKLYLIYFEGTRLYHFGKYLNEVEQIVASARIL
jgi:hypothetical protein